VVSKNGGVLLNITPTAAGEIPQPVQDRLIEMGQWLNTNGEAIYGTRPWTVYGEGPAKVTEGHLSERKNKDNTEEDVRFTQKDGALYALLLDVPSKDVEIRALGKKAALLKKEIKNIEIIGSNEKVSWETNDDFLKINKPTEKTCEHCVVFKLTF